MLRLRDEAQAPRAQLPRASGPQLCICHRQALRAHTLKPYEQGYQFPAVGPWARGPTSLGLSFLFYRMRALTGPTSQGCWEARRKCRADRATASLTPRPRSSQGSGRSLTISEQRPLSGAPRPTPSRRPRSSRASGTLGPTLGPCHRLSFRLSSRLQWQAHPALSLAQRRLLKKHRIHSSTHHPAIQQACPRQPCSAQPERHGSAHAPGSAFLRLRLERRRRGGERCPWHVVECHQGGCGAHRRRRPCNHARASGGPILGWPLGGAHPRGRPSWLP